MDVTAKNKIIIFGSDENKEGIYLRNSVDSGDATGQPTQRPTAELPVTQQPTMEPTAPGRCQGKLLCQTQASEPASPGKGSGSNQSLT